MMTRIVMRLLVVVGVLVAVCFAEDGKEKLAIKKMELDGNRATDFWEKTVLVVVSAKGMPNSVALMPDQEVTIQVKGQAACKVSFDVNGYGHGLVVNKCRFSVDTLRVYYEVEERTDR